MSHIPSYLTWVVTGSTFALFHFFITYICVRNGVHVRARHAHSPGLMEVLENEVNTTPPASYCSASVSVCSDFSSLIFQSCPLFFYFFCIFPFLLSFLSPHQSQSLDQVALTNATILDGSGGGPNGSLAGSMGSVAVCLPSESSLTDSLHTSAVSSQRIDVESPSRNHIKSSSFRGIVKSDTGPLSSEDWSWITAVWFSVLLLKWW